MASLHRSNAKPPARTQAHKQPADPYLQRLHACIEPQSGKPLHNPPPCSISPLLYILSDATPSLGWCIARATSAAVSAPRCLGARSGPALTAASKQRDFPRSRVREGQGASPSVRSERGWCCGGAGSRSSLADNPLGMQRNFQPNQPPPSLFPISAKMFSSRHECHRNPHPCTETHKLA